MDLSELNGALRKPIMVSMSGSDCLRVMTTQVRFPSAP